MAGKRYAFAQQTCIGKAGFLMQKLSMLWPHCRVGIAVSGGMDSFVLLKVMKIRQAITPFHFDIMALHCNAGFDREDHAGLLPWLANEGIPAHIETGNFGLKAHSSENRRNSPCFLCARERRKRLFQLCDQYGLSHLALGHNADDLLDTFMLNFMRNGRVEGLSACEPLFGGKLRLIRPLLLVEKKFIRQAARQWNLPVWPNSCPTSGKTGRDEMKLVTQKVAEILPDCRSSMLGAVERWQLARNFSHKGDGEESH